MNPVNRVTPSRARLAAAALGALGLGVTGAGAASATPVPATAAPAPAAHAGPVDERCEAPLPGIVLGSPQLAAGAASGARVWHDGTGWHLRVTHPARAAVAFTGIVRSGQPITARGYHLEPGDSWRLRDGGHTLTFAFTDHGGVDGLDFTDRCAARTSFSLQRGGHELSPVAVFLGAHGGHPTSDPFTVQRHHA